MHPTVKKLMQAAQALRRTPEWQAAMAKRGQSAELPTGRQQRISKTSGSSMPGGWLKERASDPLRLLAAKA